MRDYAWSGNRMQSFFPENQTKPKEVKSKHSRIDHRKLEMKKEMGRDAEDLREIWMVDENYHEDE